MSSENEPPKRPSTLRFGGVSGVLNTVQQRVEQQCRQRFTERRTAGYNTLTDDEIDMLAKTAAFEARKVAADGIGEAYQLGVNSTVKAEAHERPTTPPGMPAVKPPK